MKKSKHSDVLSLEKGEQKEVVKQTKQLKKKIQEGEITIKGDKKTKKLTIEQKRGLIYISHLPHGFYEEQLKGYFSQFGKITNIKVCRSSKTGRSKGYGYAEFFHPEVAKIAAETMNNYLMFKRRIIAEYVPYEKRPKHLFHGKATTPTKFSVKVRREKQYQANLKVNEATQRRRTTKRLSRLNKKFKKLETMGIAPNNVAGIERENKSSNVNKTKSQ